MSGFGPICTVLTLADKENQKKSRTILYTHEPVLNRSEPFGPAVYSAFPYSRVPVIGKELGWKSEEYNLRKIQPQQPPAKSSQSQGVSQSHENHSSRQPFGTSPSLLTESKPYNIKENIHKHVDHACPYFQPDLDPM